MHKKKEDFFYRMVIFVFLKCKSLYLMQWLQVIMFKEETMNGDKVDTILTEIKVYWCSKGYEVERHLRL